MVGMDSGNSLTPVFHQASTWTNVDLLPIGPIGTYLVKFQSKYENFLSKKCIWKCCLQNIRNFVQTLINLMEYDWGKKTSGMPRDPLTILKNYAYHWQNSKEKIHTYLCSLHCASQWLSTVTIQLVLCMWDQYLKSWPAEIHSVMTQHAFLDKSSVSMAVWYLQIICHSLHYFIIKS